MAAVADRGKGKEVEKMATINIDFSYDDNVKRSIKKAKSALQTRINDYSGIKKNLNNISSSTGNLSSANTYIQKKINSLESKYKKLDSFQSAITRFNDNAYNADKRVANRINTDTKQFYKRENIKTGVIYTVGSVIGSGVKWLKGKAEDLARTIASAVSSAWEAVKQWYKDNKYWIDIVVDVVCVVAAIAACLTAGGVVLFVFAAWGLAKAGTDLVYDVAAYEAYKDGDMELYEELSKGGLKTVMKEYLGDAGEYIYYGMEIASAIYGVYKIGKSVKQIFKDYKLLNAPLQDNLASTMLSDGIKKQIIISDIKNTVFKTIGIKNLDSATGNLNVSNIISGAKWTIKTVQSIITAESIGDFTIDTIKITSTIKSGFTNIKDLITKISTPKITINCVFPITPSMAFV